MTSSIQDGAHIVKNRKVQFFEITENVLNGRILVFGFLIFSKV
jgi:hypothetical protein